MNRPMGRRDSSTCPNQTGFRPGCGCANQIFMLRKVLGHHFKYLQPTVMYFIDFPTAFDMIE